MKRILGFLVGLVMGFFLIETLSAPAFERTTNAPAAREPSEAPTATVGAVASVAISGAPRSTESLPERLAKARPAREAPGAFFYGARLLRSGFDLKDWRDDADATAAMLEVARREARTRYAPLADLLELSEEKQALLYEIIAGQAVYLGPGPLPTENDSRLGLIRQLSDDAVAKLSPAFSAEELETLAAARGVSEHIARVAEAFGARGLPLSREQMRTLIRPDVSGYAGEGYRTLRFDPFAGVGLTPEQWAYLAKYITWQNALELTGAVESTKVRDPDLLDIWPN